MNSMDIPVGLALLAIGALGQISAWQIRKLLGGIHVSVDGNLSRVKDELVITAQALVDSKTELAEARKDIEFLKTQMLQAGVSTAIHKMRKSGAKR